jgi:Ion channel
MPRLPKASLWIGGGTLLSLGLSIGLVEYFSAAPDSIQSLSTVIAVLLWFTYHMLVVGLIIGSIVVAFQKHERTDLFLVILTSYVAIIFVFAGLYYLFSSQGDRNDAVGKYLYYETEGRKVDAHLISEAVDAKDARAFSGIKARLWSGADWPILVDPKWSQSPIRPDYLEPGATEISATQRIAAARSGKMGDVVKFIPPARLAVFYDCVHLSITTITTVGLGDIIPTTWYSKMAVDAEILAGVSLAVLALGLALSGR